MMMKIFGTKYLKLIKTDVSNTNVITVYQTSQIKNDQAYILDASQ